MGLGRKLKGLFGSEAPPREAAPRRSRTPAQPTLQPARIAAGETIYAIGDIHGRADLLGRLIEMLALDMTDEQRTTLVFLGDYVDRGEQSREVIDHCIDLQQAFQGRTVFLKGNHEDAMLNFLEAPIRAANWLTFGGLATLMSYGVRGINENMGDAALQEARDHFADNLPDSHLDFLDGLQLSHSVDSHFFCHAGIDPHQHLDSQSERVLMWGNGRKPTDYANLRQTVVHGHYVTDAPEVGQNRVSVDTGAYFSSRLTALKLTSESAEFLHT